MTQVGLTPRQRAIYDQLRLGVQRGRVPSLEEIAVAIGISKRAKGYIREAIMRIEERGYVRRVPGKHRAIEIIDGPWELPPRIDTLLAVECEKRGRRPGEIIAAALEAYFAVR